MNQIIMILYSNRIGGESMNINDTINLMKKLISKIMLILWVMTTMPILWFLVQNQ